MKYCLLWICSSLSPYNSFLFRSLNADNILDLRVVALKSNDIKHPWQTDLSSGFNFRNINLFFWIDWKVLIEAVQSKTNLVVIAGWNSPTTFVLASILALMNKPFVLWTDTPDLYKRRNVLKVFFRNRWLLWVFEKAVAVMGTGSPARRALKKMGCSDFKIVDFPFFVDLDRYNKRYESLDKQLPILFVSVGRVENKIKGHDVAIKAFSRIDRKFEWEYVIVGSGPDNKNIINLIDKYGLKNNVKVTGWMEPDKVTEVLKKAQVYVHPSLRDAYPAAVLEAMAAGLPIIGSNASGSVVDRIDHNKSGLIHSAGDIDELAQHLEWTLLNVEKVFEMGKQSRLVAEKWPVSIAVRIIREILQR